jgi:hypothetical protein
MNTPSLRLAIGVAVGLAIGAATGCGLISSDVTNFDLTLPDKKFTIDMGGWQFNSTARDTYLMRTCSASNPTFCNTAVQQLCTMGCSGSCGASNTCELSLDVSLSQTVNLLMEKPELKSINDEPVIKVTIDSVTYEIPSNTLNLDTPEFTVYVAPASVLKTNDPQAKAIGTIPPVPAGWVTDAPHSFTFSATGRAELVNLMSAFKTPFNVLVGSSLLVTANQPVPTGKLDAVIHIKGHAGL